LACEGIVAGQTAKPALACAMAVSGWCMGLAPVNGLKWIERGKASGNIITEKQSGVDEI